MNPIGRQKRLHETLLIRKLWIVFAIVVAILVGLAVLGYFSGRWDVPESEGYGDDDAPGHQLPK